jgi:hypothetical protein
MRSGDSASIAHHHVHQRRVGGRVDAHNEVRIHGGAEYLRTSVSMSIAKTRLGTPHGSNWNEILPETPKSLSSGGGVV